MIKAKSASYYTDNKNNLAKEKIISLYQLVYVCNMRLIFVLILHYIMELKIIIYFILGRHIITCIVSKSSVCYIIFNLEIGISSSLKFYTSSFIRFDSCSRHINISI